ncbi:MAG: hypothetical protein WA885_17075 [Phormidesmis sp.]
MNSFLDAALENQLLAVLALLSFVLLLVVTIGVGYLTAVEWRDRRRRNSEVATLPRPAAASKRTTGKKESKKEGKKKRKSKP